MRFWKPRKAAGNPLASVVVATYLHGKDAARRKAQLACLLYCLRAQTHENWEAVVVHDGPVGQAWPVPRDLHDHRVSFVETPDREGRYGHRWRRAYALKHSRGRYVGFCNDDAYFAPTYLEALLDPLANRGARLAYCNFVLSHKLWQPVAAKVQRGQIDVAGWLVDRVLLEQVPWENFEFAGDWFYVQALAKAAGKAVASVPHYLYVHN